MKDARKAHRIEEIEARCRPQIQIASLVTGGFHQQLAGGEAAPVEASTYDLPVRPVQLDDGTELHVFEHGKGHAVVFVHGSFADYRAWFAQMADFGRVHRVIVYSRRHHHPNRWAGDPQSVDIRRHAEDLTELICKLGIGPATLVAQSSGGLVALHAARKRPDLVHSLVLSEPFVPDALDSAPAGVEAWRDYERKTWQPAARAFMDGRTERGVEILCDAILGEGAFASFDPDVRHMVMQNAPEMHLEFSNDGFFSAFSMDDARAVRSPTLLVGGEISPSMFTLMLDALESAMPDVERRVFPGISHVPPFVAPADFNSAALSFLQRHLPRA